MLAAAALLLATAPAAAGPTPQDYDPGKIFNDTDMDFATALNVTANQSQKMEFWLDCPGANSTGEYDFLYVWVGAGMDLSFHVEVDPLAGTSFRTYLVSPEYFRLVQSNVPPSGANDSWFNTTTRVSGQYFLAMDGLASCFVASYYNVTWMAAPTGAPNDGDNSVANAVSAVNNTLVSSSLTETTDQADFIRIDVTVPPSPAIVLLRLTNASGIILTSGFQFEVYNATGVIGMPPAMHQGLSPNTTAIGLIQNGLQVRDNTSFIIRMWSNGLSGTYSFRVSIFVYMPTDTNLDYGSARTLNEIPSLDGGSLDYTFERTHYFKIFVGGPTNARTFHVQAWSNDINVGLSIYSETAGTLAHVLRASSHHFPVSTQVPADFEVIDHYASAANLTGETGWYYIVVNIDDDLPPRGTFAVAFYFNDGPVGTSNVGLTTTEDTSPPDFDVSSMFSDLDCTLDAGDPDCSLALAMTSAATGNITWDFSGSPMLRMTPRANWSGMACADFNATDSWNRVAVAQVCLTVTPVNDAPELVPGVPPAREDVPEDGSVTRLVSSWFSDIENDTLTIGFSGNTNFSVTLTVTPPFVEAIITPAPNWNGCENITYTATDPGLLSVSHTVDTCVLPMNDAPTIRGGLPEVAVNEDSTATLNLDSVLILGVTGPAFSDIDGDALTFRVYDLVDVQVSVSGSVLTITPNPNFAGLASFSVAAYDGITESTRAPVRVRVAAVNDAPTVDGATPSVSPVIMSEGEDRTFTVTASDIDGDPLTFTWYVDGVGQIDSNKTSFTISVAITEELARSLVVRVQVADGAGGSDERSWTVNIQNTNLAPTVTITAPTANAVFSTEDDITFSSTTADPDGDTITYSWSSDRVGAAIGDQQTFTTKLPAGTHNIRLVISDGTNTTSANVTIVVNAPPPPPPGFLPGPEALAAVGAIAVAGAVATLMVRTRRKR